MSNENEMMRGPPPSLLNSLVLDTSDTSMNPLSEDMRVGAHDASLSSCNTNTEKTTRWAVNAYNNWRLARQPGIKEMIPDLASGSVEELNQWLSLFVRECKQRDGREYKHQNLYAMVCGISRYIRKNRPNLNILDDVGMKDFKVSLYDVMKRLQSKQATLYNVQVSKISRKQWDYFWEKGLLGDSNPTALFYAVYTLFISVTGVTSALQLRSMTTRNIEVIKDPQTEKFITTYYPIPSVSKPDRAAIKCTDDGTHPRSFGRLLQLYLSRLPPFFSDLWVRPNPNPDPHEWFSKQPLGQNILRTTVKSICQVAGFEGNYSNQSLGRDLLNWEHYEIDHLMQMTSSSREGDHRSQIKREITSGELLSSVTVNTHFPASKRLKMEGSDRGDAFVCLPSTQSPHVSGIKGSLIPPSIPSNLIPPPSAHVLSSSSQESAATPSSHFTVTSPRISQFQSSSQSSDSNRTDQSGSSRDNNGPCVGQDLRDVHVTIPDHINQCLGLFKDCTIQNVTINIYLDKEGQDP